MALSSSVDLLRWSPAGEFFRIAVSLQRGESPHHVCAAAAPSMSVLNRNVSNRLVTASRLRWRHQQQGPKRLLIVRASQNSNSSNNQTEETGTSSSEADVEAVEARLGLGRRARKQQSEIGSPQGAKTAVAPAKPKEAAKKWDSMSLAEKAWSLYIDPEKGILFWLNKLAYGAIFAIIGGWIVFRFVGPALGTMGSKNETYLRVNELKVEYGSTLFL